MSGSLLAAAGLAALLLAASRRAEFSGLAAAGFLAAALGLEAGAGGPAGRGAPAWLPAGAAALAGGLCLWLCLRGGLFRFPAGGELKWWRMAARPFALLFVPIDRLFGRTALLWLLGALALAFAGLDLARLLARVPMRGLFKRSEGRRFSSMTAFLVAVFLCFLVFPDHLPFLCLGFLAIGDLFGKLVGLRFGRLRLRGGRTLEGSLAFAAGGFAAAWLLRLALRGASPPVPLYAVLAGPAFAALVEMFSGRLDDNLTVGVVSGGFLYSLRYFLGV